MLNIHVASVAHEGRTCTPVAMPAWCAAGAVKAGYAGFMVTVDAPRLGNRISDERNK